MAKDEETDRAVTEFLSASRGSCPDCGYALAGLQRPVCPECGQRIFVRISRSGPDVAILLLAAAALGASMLRDAHGVYEGIETYQAQLRHNSSTVVGISFVFTPNPVVWRFCIANAGGLAATIAIVFVWSVRRRKRRASADLFLVLAALVKIGLSSLVEFAISLFPY